MSELRVSALNIYPVKSAGGIDLQQMSIGSLGPQYDRCWMLVDGQGRFLTQRQHPRMCLIGTALEAGVLKLSGPDTAPLTVASPATVQPTDVQVWDDRVQALDCGDAAAQWLSEFLSIDCRLVFMPEDGQRLVDTDYARDGERVSFADGFPLLLISQASLEALNSELDTPVPMNRFRPNLVVSGCEPFAEDGWRGLRVGELEFAVVKPCSRCAIPSIDQASATRDGQINRVLARTRRRDGVVYFGQNLLCRGQGQIALGDRVELLN